MNDIISTPKEEIWSFLKKFILVFLCILFFQPFLKVSAQEEVESLVKPNPEPKYILGPQLLPVSSNPENNADNPGPLLLETSCPNSNFSTGTWANWTGCYGFFAPNTWCETVGFKTLGPHPLHKIIPGPGYHDFRTCNGLTNVFPGESFSARLGDTVYNSNQHQFPKEAELKYEVTVSTNSYLFIYRYAIILQTGGHAPNMQPDFRVQITDASVI